MPTYHATQPPSIVHDAHPLQAVGVASAGIERGTGVNANAVAVMAEAGVDISGHSSDAMVCAPQGSAGRRRWAIGWTRKLIAEGNRMC